MRVVRYFLMVLVVLFGVSFAVLNSASVTVDLFLWRCQLPLAMLVILVFGMGLLFGLTAGFLTRVTSKRRKASAG